jgi:ubiquinone/menaquinone biosynthesis C-methylase UbiE
LNLKPAFTQSHTLHLPFANQHFDWVVATFVLYIVPDIQRTLAEIARVLKPGGRLLFFEFYFSETHNRNPIIRWALNLFTLIYGPNFYRRTSAYLHEAGFEMQQRTGLATNGIAELVMASHNRSGSSGFYGVSRRVMSDE